MSVTLTQGIAPYLLQDLKTFIGANDPSVKITPAGMLKLAVIDDLICGNRIIQRRISWADLTPITERTVTTTITVERRQPLIKLYLGADLGVRYASPLTRGGIDIAPATSVVSADRYMIDLGYYILGGEITAGMKVKVGFKR